MWWLKSNGQPFVSLCSAFNNWTPAWKWQLDFSCSATRTLALDHKCFFFGEKNQITQQWTSVSKPLFPNFQEFHPNFGQIKTFGGALTPSALHHWMDSATLTLKKVYTKAKYLIFPAECTSHSIASPLHWIIYIVNNNLKKFCLLHLREIHYSNLTYLGFQRLDNLA